MIAALAPSKARKGDLAADLVDPGGDDVRCVQLALGGLEARVADHAGGAADQGDGLVAGFLEALEDEHRTRWPRCRLSAVGSKPQ
jgi:hypothetical protein